MKHIARIAALFGACSGLLHAATSFPSTDPFSEWIDKHHVKLVGDSNDVKLSAAPASIGYRDSRAGDPTTQIQASLLIDLFSFLSPSNFTEANALQFGFDFHRDSTFVPKTNREKQNLLAVTLVHDYQAQPGEGKFAPIVKTGLTFKNDRVDKGQGILATIGLSGYYSRWRLNKVDRSDGFPLKWSPVIELQFENKDGLQTNPPATKPLDGNVTRAKAALAVFAYPLRGTFGRRIELSVRYDYWRNLARSGIFATADYPRNERNTTASLTIWGDEQHHIGIAFDHANGENPEKNKPRDRTNEVALKVMF